MYYTTKVKDCVITLTTTSIEMIFNLNLDPLKFLPLMSTAKASKLGLQKYVHPSKIKKTNKSYVFYSDLRILYFIVGNN